MTEQVQQLLPGSGQAPPTRRPARTTARARAARVARRYRVEFVIAVAVVLIELLETRERAHFMRIADHEWGICRQQLQKRYAK